MKTLLLTFTLLALSPVTERTVYICESKNAVAYHLKRDCQGLQKCKSTTTTVSESAAKSKGLHLCGFED